MRIVLVGAGEVGYTVAKNLSEDGHDIVVIEENEENAEHVETMLDVLVLRGNGARPSVLARAGITEGKNDIALLIACTDKDEVNLMACWIAKRMGVPHVIARAVGLEFTDNEEWARGLGIDMLISPERSVAKQIEELLEIRAAIHATDIADGKAGIYVFRITRDSHLCGHSLIQLRRAYPNLILLIIHIRRGSKSFVPSGTEVLQEGDICYTICYRAIVSEVERIFQPSFTKKLKHVFIVGAGKIGFQTASRLISHIHGIDIRLVEKDRTKCERFARELPQVSVLCADGSDVSLLKSEGIESADGYVAATDHDETNLMLAVLAKTLGVSKSIAVVQRPNYLNMTNVIPVDAIVNRNQTLANVITRSVRYPGSSRVLTVLEEIDAETVELTLTDTSPATGQSLMELKMPQGSIVALVERKNEMLIPTGGTILKSGDKILVFASADVINDAMHPFGEDKL
ncbi:MAG: Trk system potassium transporter TrkA [Synergistes sp.]|nr:Trk system potassium transporter TrkA [Synergistes sp.]